jgi:Matrixin
MPLGTGDYMKKPRWHLMIRTAAGLASLTMAITVPLSATATAANAAPNPPAFCGGTSAIPASALAGHVNIRACHIRGRKVVMNFGRGRPAEGVYIQAPGKGQTIIVTATNGEYELTVNTDTHGNVVAKQSFASTPGSIATPRVASIDAACGEGAWNAEGGIWYSPNASPTLLWYYNESTASRAGLSGSATLSDIRAGNYNMTNGINNCGYAEGTFAIHGSYQGTTSRYANINSAPGCTSNFPDGQNTVSWGPIDSSHYNQSTHVGTLALTCIERGSFNGMATITEADIYLGSNVDMVDSLPSNCTYQEDLQTIVTHEWGHAFGLAHESSGAAEVMYPTRPWCTLRRHLGNGDWTGMASLYGLS